jgi:hypothetical protein
MAVDATKPPEASAPKPWAPFIEAALAAGTPRLYADNAFRVLGLSALASVRDVAKRFDQLQMSQQLGTEPDPWAFAPSPAATIEKLREAVQRLKEPRLRVVDEFFWFWPESYPEADSDAAYDLIMRGEVSEAVALWASKTPEESPGALHNLAVYHHLMAVEQELAGPAVADEDKIAWWSASVRYWQSVSRSDAVWKMLESRIKNLADPQVSSAWVPHFRKALPEVLSAINAAFALRSAESADTPGAARNVAVLGDIFPDSQSARAALDRGMAPVLRRIEARVADARRRVANAPSEGIDAARELIVHCSPDIQIADTLAGSDSDFFAETCSRVVSPALDAVVAYQRATTDNESCLSLLVALRGYVTTPELQRRLSDTFAVIYDNVLSQSLDARSSDAPEDAPLYAKRYEILRELLIPRVLALELGDRVLANSSIVLAEMLKEVAKEAFEERDDVEFAAHALQTVQLLPLSEREKSQRATEAALLESSYRESKAREFQLELPGGFFAISRRGVVWNGETLRIDEIEAIRHGRTGVSDAGATDYVVGWRTAGAEVVLDGASVFTETGAAEEQYTRIVEGLYYFVVPQLIQKLVTAIQSGETVTIGTAGVRKTGIVMPASGRLFRREQEVPFSKISQRLEAGAWIVGPADQPRYAESYPTVHTWNAAIIGYVIDALAVR